MIARSNLRDFFRSAMIAKRGNKVNRDAPFLNESVYLHPFTPDNACATSILRIRGGSENNKVLIKKNNFKRTGEKNGQETKISWISNDCLVTMISN
jgi:hypothetical protein